MHRAYLAVLGLAAALPPALVGCARPDPPDEFVGPAAPKRIYASTLERRLSRVRLGQSAEEVSALVGSPRVRRPGSATGSFASPLRRATLETPEGERVEIELYVVTATPADGCPDVHTELAPVVYLDGEVAALDWDYVERHWRGWGGGLAALRELRRSHECSSPPPPS